MSYRHLIYSEQLVARVLSSDDQQTSTGQPEASGSTEGSVPSFSAGTQTHDSQAHNPPTMAPPLPRVGPEYEAPRNGANKPVVQNGTQPVRRASVSVGYPQNMAKFAWKTTGPSSQRHSLGPPAQKMPRIEIPDTPATVLNNVVGSSGMEMEPLLLVPVDGTNENIHHFELQDVPRQEAVNTGGESTLLNSQFTTQAAAFEEELKVCLASCMELNSKIVSRDHRRRGNKIHYFSIAVIPSV